MKKPLGLLRAAGLNRVASGGASTILPDALIDMSSAIPSPLVQGPSAPLWLMNRNTVRVVRKFKGTDGHYLWQPGLQLGQPATLLGYEVLMDRNRRLTATLRVG